MKVETVKLYVRFAEEYQLEILSMSDEYANFKEYDGDGFFNIKKTLKEIKQIYKIK